MSFNKIVETEIKYWLFVLAASCGIIAGFHYAYMWVRPGDTAIFETFLLRTSMMVDGLAFLLFGLVATDLVTPGDWLQKVGEDAKACAMVLSSVCFCLAWIYARS